MYDPNADSGESVTIPDSSWDRDVQKCAKYVEENDISEGRLRREEELDREADLEEKIYADRIALEQEKKAEADARKKQKEKEKAAKKDQAGSSLPDGQPQDDTEGMDIMLERVIQKQIIEERNDYNAGTRIHGLGENKPSGDDSKKHYVAIIRHTERADCVQ